MSDLSLGITPAAAPRDRSLHAMCVPLVAAIAALAFGTLPADRALVATVAASALVVLSAIDIERRVIPNRIVLPASALVAALNAVLFPARALEWPLAALVAAAVLALPSLLGRDWIGMGDAKLALLIGAALGWGAVVALPLGLLCTFPAAVAIVLRRGLSARTATVPLAPFLALGALLVIFAPTIAGISA